MPDLPLWLWRGYTGHEHLPEFGLINMNGRCYDPILGRMLSPDNFVQDPGNSINFNRYAYVLNNPLKYVDPSGERITKYEDEDGSLIIETNDGNDATVTIANEDVSEFIEKTLELVLDGTIDDVGSNQQLIEQFGDNMFWEAQVGERAADWAKIAIGYPVKDYFVNGPNGGDYGSSWANTVAHFNSYMDNLRGNSSNNYAPPSEVVFMLDLAPPVAFSNGVSAITKGETIWGRPLNNYQIALAVLGVASPYTKIYKFGAVPVTTRTVLRTPGAFEDAKYVREY